MFTRFFISNHPKALVNKCDYVDPLYWCVNLWIIILLDVINTFWFISCWKPFTPLVCLLKTIYLFLKTKQGAISECVIGY